MLIIRKAGGFGDLTDAVLSCVQQHDRLLYPVFVEEVQKCLFCDLLKFSAEIAGADPQIL